MHIVFVQTWIETWLWTDILLFIEFPPLVNPSKYFWCIWHIPGVPKKRFVYSLIFPFFWDTLHILNIGFMAYHLTEYFLSVGHESDMKGRGVMAIQDIPFGCVVANYEGELIRSDVMYKSYDWLGLIFLGGGQRLVNMQIFFPQENWWWGQDIYRMSIHLFLRTRQKIQEREKQRLGSSYIFREGIKISTLLRLKVLLTQRNR